MENSVFVVELVKTKTAERNILKIFRSILRKNISRGCLFFICKKVSQVYFFILYYLYTIVLTTRLIK